MTSTTAGRRLIVLLGALTAFGPLSIDMYLPAFPAIQGEFGGSAGAVQATLTTFFIGLAAGQPVYGPLSDRYGRRRPLLAGLALYVLASAAATLADDLTGLALARLLQALGGCAGLVIARAVIADRFEGKDAARAFSLIMLVMGLAPVLAPILGGQVLRLAGWRMIFWLLAGFGALCFALVLRGLPESLPRDRRSRGGLRRVAGAFRTLAGNRRFMAYGAVATLSFSGLFAYIAGSPFVFISGYGLTPQQYGLLFGLNAVGLMLASQINLHLLRRWSLGGILAAGCGLNLLAALLLLAVALAAPAGPLPLILPLFLAIASIGLIGPNATAAAMDLGRQQAGAASALLGVLQFAVAAAAGTAIGLVPGGTAVPMALAITALAGTALLTLRATAAAPAGAGH